MLLRNRGLGTTRKSVMRWERGVVPDNAAQSALAQLFGIPLKARSTASWPSWLPTGRVTGVGQTWDDPGTIEVLTEVAEYAIVDRREFIALTGPELLLPIYAWRLNPGPWLARRTEGQSVSPALVSEIQGLIAVRRRMDDERGGAGILEMLSADLSFVSGVLKHGRYDKETGRSLYASAAELARLAGWAASDSGKQAASQQYYLAGLRAATAAGDHALAVNIVGFLGAQAYSNGHLSESMQLMNAAVAESGKLPAIVQAMSWARSARAYAALGDSKAARNALNLSAAQLDKAVEGDSPAWAYWFDEARYTAQVGRALFDLEDYDGAERELTMVIEHYGDRFPRDRAKWYGRIAIAQAATGNVEQACASGRLAVDLVSSHVTSQRALSFLRSFIKILEDTTDATAARGFIQYARERLPN
jgi:tetratricopeptide (TPR) repeat protein